MVLIRIIIEVEVEMAIKGVVAEDSIILVLILDLTMVNPLEVQMYLNFLVINHNLSIRVVLVFLHFSFTINIRIQDLLVRFVARMVMLHWTAIIA